MTSDKDATHPAKFDSTLNSIIARNIIDLILFSTVTNNYLVYYYI